jgi:tetratricopeptide (TPR) repeat protein
MIWRGSYEAIGWQSRIQKMLRNSFISNICLSGLIKKIKEPIASLHCISIALVFAFFFCLEIPAQSALLQQNRGAIQGRVLDSTGQPVRDASVSLEQEGHSKTAMTTKSDGSFLFSELPAGTYQIHAEKSGKHSPVTTLTLGNEFRNIEVVFVPGSVPSSSGSASSSTQTMQFADQPNFTVAGITDWTAAGGHGSDVVLRTSETITHETAALKPSISSSSVAGAGAAERLRSQGDQDEKSGDPLAAEREYEQAVHLDPSEQNYFAWGSELLLHRAVQPAMEVFAEGNRRYPKSSRMLAGLGASLFSAGRYDDAALRMCAASDLNPKDTAPYIFLGKIETAAPLPLDCVETKLSRFVQTQPENALANYYYAMAIWKRERGGDDLQIVLRVEALFEKALKLDPTLTDAYLQLGILNFSEHKFERAIDLYTKAIEVDPQFCDAHFRLGQAYQRIGDVAKAKSEFQLHDELEKQQAADIERQRKEVKQFMIVLKDQP